MLSAQISSSALRASFEPMFCRPKHIEELWLAQKVRQLGHVHRNPPRLIARQQFGRPGVLILCYLLPDEICLQISSLLPDCSNETPSQL
jgi:hypothetical protein